jgi:hypothetical protein
VRQKNCLLKFTWKIQNVRKVLGHNLVSKYLKKFDAGSIALELEQEFTEFLSEQLKRMVEQGCSLAQAEETIGLCFRALGRQELYYGVI